MFILCMTVSYCLQKDTRYLAFSEFNNLWNNDPEQAYIPKIIISHMYGCCRSVPRRVLKSIKAIGSISQVTDYKEVKDFGGLHLPSSRAVYIWLVGLNMVLLSTCSILGIIPNQKLLFPLFCEIQYLPTYWLVFLYVCVRL